MKKKLPILLLLSLFALSGCKNDESETPSDDPNGSTSEVRTSSEDDAVYHTVTFWEDIRGTLYERVSVKHGEKVVMPSDPVRAGDTFRGWYSDSSLETAFNSNAPIMQDTKAYGKWASNEVLPEPTYRTLHLIGDPANTDIDYVSWDDVTDYHERSLLSKDETNKLYYIELELGYGASFKIKDAGVAWEDTNQIIIDFDKLLSSESSEYIENDDMNNFVVKKEGLYNISVDAYYFNVTVTRVGEATGEGVVTEEQATAFFLHLVGNFANPGLEFGDWVTGSSRVNPASYLSEGDSPNLFSIEVELGYGASFKITEPRLGWDVAAYKLGYANVTTASLAANTIESEGDGNIVVKNAGLYLITVDTEVHEITITRIGDAVGPDVVQNPGEHVPLLHVVGVSENTALAYINWDTETYDPLSLLTYDAQSHTYEITLELGYEAKLKVKEPEKAWDEGIELTFGDLNSASDLLKLHEVGNNEIGFREAGVYKITVDLNAEKRVLVKYVGPSTSEGVTRPVVTHTVTFYIDDGANAYHSYAAAEGDTVVVPLTPPTMNEVLFDGWYSDLSRTIPLDQATVVTAPLAFYAKWVDDEGTVVEPETPEQIFHIIGSFGLEDGEDWWDTTGANDYFHFKYDEAHDVYKTKVSLGHNAELKIKEVSPSWDDEEIVIFDYNNIPAHYAYPYLASGEGDNPNIIIKLAGSYEVIMDLNAETLNFVWLNNDFGDTYIQQTITSSKWGVVGSNTNWGDSSDLPMVYDKVSGATVAYAVYFEEGATWKIRYDGKWDTQFGHRSFNNYVDDVMEKTSVEDSDDIYVKEAGYYTIVYTEDVYGNGMLTVQKLRFALRGSALPATMWHSDSAPLTYVGASEDQGTKHTFSATYTFAVGELRAKLAPVEAFDYMGLEFLAKHSAETPSLVVSEAGEYVVTLNVWFNANGTLANFNYSIAPAL